MVKANELRIGNLIIRKDLGNGNERIETIIELGEKAVTSGPVKVICQYSSLNPIPLTEEWLLKFGFIKESDISGEFFSISKHRVYLFKETFEFELNTHDEHRFNLFKSFQYVHQLQNLYFALTGEDLIITDHK